MKLYVLATTYAARMFSPCWEAQELSAGIYMWPPLILWKPADSLSTESKLEVPDDPTRNSRVRQ